jgi:hypothetical protein
MQLRISMAGIGLSLLIGERTSSLRSKMLKNLLGILVISTILLRQLVFDVPAFVREPQGEMRETNASGWNITPADQTKEAPFVCQFILPSRDISTQRLARADRRCWYHAVLYSPLMSHEKRVLQRVLQRRLCEQHAP